MTDERSRGDIATNKPSKQSCIPPGTNRKSITKKIEKKIENATFLVSYFTTKSFQTFVIPNYSKFLP